MNLTLQGWINYYSKFNKTEFRKVMNYLNEKLSRWFICEFKKLRYGYIVRAIYALTLTV
ncbi:group II intron maturase-specific domain-containing protein [Parabacteroides distasonis]|uniref:group II intron maturase-specific domain-containing protein n=1 Tax=Parabacteroides distasonis TaxID=823 RepID=UPI0039B45800